MKGVSRRGFIALAATAPIAPLPWATVDVGDAPRAVVLRLVLKGDGGRSVTWPAPPWKIKTLVGVERSDRV